MDKEGDAEPSSWENEGFAGFLPTLITCRQCDDAVGEGRWFKGLTVDLGWRGRRWGRWPAGAQDSPGSGGKGEKDADAAGGCLLVHHGDGGDVQELDRLLEKLML